MNNLSIKKGDKVLVRIGGIGNGNWQKGIIRRVSKNNVVVSSREFDACVDKQFVKAR